MRTVQRGPLVGMAAQLALLGVLAATVGIGMAGWVVGVLVGAVTNGLLARALHRNGCTTIGPANAVTLTRATLVGGIAALIAVSAEPAGVGGAATPATVPVLVALCAVALLLDGVDGQVARRTGTVSALGARPSGAATARSSRTTPACPGSGSSRTSSSARAPSACA